MTVRVQGIERTRRRLAGPRVRTAVFTLRLNLPQRRQKWFSLIGRHALDPQRREVHQATHDARLKTHHIHEAVK